jgi:hypothetical protein
MISAVDQIPDKNYSIEQIKKQQKNIEDQGITLNIFKGRKVDGKDNRQIRKQSEQYNMFWHGNIYFLMLDIYNK